MIGALPDPKDEALAQALGNGLTLAEAWLQAGNKSKNANSAAVSCTKRLKRLPLIRQRADELASIARTQAENEKFIGSRQQLAQMLLDDRAAALADNKHSAAIAATMGLVKLYGLGSETVRGDPEAPVQTSRIELVGVSASVPVGGVKGAAA